MHAADEESDISIISISFSSFTWDITWKHLKSKLLVIIFLFFVIIESNSSRYNFSRSIRPRFTSVYQRRLFTHQFPPIDNLETRVAFAQQLYSILLLISKVDNGYNLLVSYAAFYFPLLARENRSSLGGWLRVNMDFFLSRQVVAETIRV